MRGRDAEERDQPSAEEPLDARAVGLEDIDGDPRRRRHDGVDDLGVDGGVEAAADRAVDAG